MKVLKMMKTSKLVSMAILLPAVLVFHPRTGMAEEHVDRPLTASASIKDTKGNAADIYHGDPCNLELVLENETEDRALIVLGIEIADQAPDTTSWFRSKVGGIKAMNGGYAYCDMLQHLTERPFAEMVILPRSKAVHKRKIVALREQFDVTVTYYSVPLDWAAKHFFFLKPEHEPHRSYTLCLPRTVAELKKGFDTSKDPILVDRRPAEDTKSTLKTSVRISLLEPEPALSQALKQAPFEPSARFYWKKRRGWYFSDGKLAVLVSDKVTPMPVISITAVLPVTRADSLGILLPEKGYEAFHPNHPSMSGPGYYTLGVTGISPVTIDAFLETVRKNGDRIVLTTRDPNGLGADNYLAVELKPHPLE